LAALGYAERMHAGQVRKADGQPFIRHPLEVALILYTAGAPDEVIAAGALHDTVEKTDADVADLRERFGSRVAEIVLTLTEDDSITGYETRKAALRDQVAYASHDALMVFAADKISKARELHLAAPAAKASRHHPRATRERNRKLVHYNRCLELLERRMANSPLVQQLRTELAHASRSGAVRIE